jgi:hypothetical protein
MADDDNLIDDDPEVKKAWAKVEECMSKLEEIVKRSERVVSEKKAKLDPIIECAYCHERIKKSKAYCHEDNEEYFCDEEHYEMYWD